MFMLSKNQSKSFAALWKAMKHVAIIHCNIAACLEDSSNLRQRTDFCREVKSIGKTLHCPIYELDEPLIRAKGAKQICPRSGIPGCHDYFGLELYRGYCPLLFYIYSHC